MSPATLGVEASLDASSTFPLNTARRNHIYQSKHSIHLTGRLWKVHELVVLRFRLELFCFFAKYFAS